MGATAGTLDLPAAPVPKVLPAPIGLPFAAPTAPPAAAPAPQPDVDISQKIGEMVLTGLGSKSQAEPGSVICGARDGGMRVHPEIRTGSPNSVLGPRGLGHDELGNPRR